MYGLPNRGKVATASKTLVQSMLKVYDKVGSGWPHALRFKNSTACGPRHTTRPLATEAPSTMNITMTLVCYEKRGIRAEIKIV